MSQYFRDRVQGVGAIAAAAPAPRSAPAPSVSNGNGTFALDARRGDPMLYRSRQARRYGRHQVLPGVSVVTETLTRPAVLMSGLRRGRAPMSGLGLDEAGMGTRTPPSPIRTARLSIRASTAGMKPAAYVPPVAPMITPLTVSVSGARTMTYPAPRIGTGIGQAPGTVVTTVPTPYGPGVTAPTATVGTGAVYPVVQPLIEEYDAVAVGPQGGMSSGAGILTYPAPSSSLFTARNLALAGGAALVLYFLTRKKR